MFRKTLCLACALALLVTLCPCGAAASESALTPSVEAITASMELSRKSLERHEAEEYEESLALINEAIFLYPIQMLYRFQRAKLAVEMGDLETAQQDCNIALAFLVDEEEIEAFAREVELARTGKARPDPSVADDDAAEKAYDKAADLADWGDFAGAIAVLDEAIESNPENAWLYEKRGLCRFYLGKEPEKALTDLSYVLRYSVMDYGELRNYVGGLQSLNRRDEALFFMNIMIDMDPEDPTGYYGRANYYYKRGDYEASLPDFTKALALVPEQPIFLADRGDAYFHLGRYEEALADYLLSALRSTDDSAFRMSVCYSTFDAILKQRVQENAYAPPKAQLEMLTRFAALCAEAGISPEPVSQFTVDAAGIPVYRLADGINLRLFYSAASGAEVVYLLTVENVSALEQAAFTQLWQGFVLAADPEIHDVHIQSLGRSLGLAAPGAKGLAEGLTGMGYAMEGWYFDRLDLDGTLHLAAFQTVKRSVDEIAQAMPSHTYSPETLRATLARFVQFAAEEKLPALDPKAAATEDTSEDGLSILWRGLAPGLRWGEAYNEADGSFHAFRLMLETGALIEDAERWTAVAMRAMNENMPPLVAAEYSHYLFYAPEENGEKPLAVRLMLDGRAYSATTAPDSFTLEITGNLPEEAPEE